MGEVYRAKDTSLGREVAIKTLPVQLSSDRESLRRLEQEARSASALNHPNIVTIYEFAEVDSTRYIAMELVDGQTLRQLLASGSLPLRQTILCFDNHTTVPGVGGSPLLQHSNLPTCKPFNLPCSVSFSNFRIRQVLCLPHLRKLSGCGGYSTFGYRPGACLTKRTGRIPDTVS